MRVAWISGGDIAAPGGILENMRGAKDADMLSRDAAMVSPLKLGE